MVQIRLRRPFVVMAVVTYVVLLGGPVAVSVPAMLLLPARVGLPFGVGAIGFSLLLGYVMSGSFHWVEIRGDVIRAKKLLTRRVVERRVADIYRITPLVSGLGGVANAVLDAALKTKNRGYLLRFLDDSEMALIRGDMANLDAFTEALRDRLGKRWALVTS